MEINPPKEKLHPIFSGPIIGITGYVHAAGTTTITNQLAEVLGICHQHAGQERKRKALEWYQSQPGYNEAGVNINSPEVLEAYEVFLNQEENKQTLQQLDRDLDKYVLKEALQGARENGCIFEGKAAVPLSQTGFLNEVYQDFLQEEGLNTDSPPPPVFTILLTTDLNQAAQRDRARDLGVDVSQIELSSPQVQEDLFQRQTRLKQRMERNKTTWQENYGTEYGLDTQNLPQYYDVIIDTSNYSLEEMDKVTAMILQTLVFDPRFKQMISLQQEENILAYCKKVGIWL